MSETIAPTAVESRADRHRRRNRELAPILPARVPWRAVGAFTALAVGLAWLVASPLYFSGDGIAHPLFGLIAICMMYTPAVAAFVVVLVVARPRSIPRLLGLAPVRPLGRTLGLSAAAIVGFPLIAFAAMLLGSALGLIELDFAGLSGLASVLDAQGVETNSGALAAAAAVQLALIPVLIIPNCVATFGEEIGWRGWLLPNLLPLGTWPALLISGAVWGVWHAPLILLGYNYGRTDLLGVLLMVGWCMLLGVLFGWLRLRSASVWPAVVAHSAVNSSVSSLAIVFASEGSLVTGAFGTLLGWSGWIVLAVVVALLVVTGQFRRRPQPGLTLAESRQEERTLQQESAPAARSTL